MFVSPPFKFFPDLHTMWSTCNGKQLSLPMSFHIFWFLTVLILTFSVTVTLRFSKPHYFHWNAWWEYNVFCIYICSVYVTFMVAPYIYVRKLVSCFCRSLKKSYYKSKIKIYKWAQVTSLSLDVSFENKIQILFKSTMAPCLNDIIFTVYSL